MILNKFTRHFSVPVEIRSFSINSLPVRREIQNFNAREFHLFVVRTIIFIPFARLIIDRFSTRVVRRTRRNKFPPLKFETRSREAGTTVSIGRTPLVFLSADSSRVRVGFSSTDSPRSPPRPSFSARLDDPRPPNRNFRL